MPALQFGGKLGKELQKVNVASLKFFFFFFKLWFCKPCSLHFAAARVGLFCQSAHNDYLRLDICASDSLHYISSWNSNGSLYAAFGGENYHTHARTHTWWVKWQLPKLWTSSRQQCGHTLCILSSLTFWTWPLMFTTAVLMRYFTATAGSC